jgi:hypothetical protein
LNGTGDLRHRDRSRHQGPSSRNRERIRRGRAGLVGRPLLRGMLSPKRGATIDARQTLSARTTGSDPGASRAGSPDRSLARVVCSRDGQRHRHDVRVLERGGDPGVAEQSDHRAPSRSPPQGLHGDRSPHRLLPCEVDNTHAALADRNASMRSGSTVPAFRLENAGQFDHA